LRPSRSASACSIFVNGAGATLATEAALHFVSIPAFRR
jgi:hypothetical protein